jgi:hypothetical protein
LLFGGIALLAAFFAMTLIWSYQASSIAEVSSALTYNKLTVFSYFVFHHKNGSLGCHFYGEKLKAI